MRMLAEFASGDALVAAVRALRQGHAGRLETFTPLPLPELDTLVDPAPSRLRRFMVVAALAGALMMLGLQYYSATIDYPINSGGRPLAAWPAFAVGAFEIAILSAAVAGFVALIVLGGLTRLHHPVFDWEGIERASRDGFFVEIAFADRGAADRAESEALARLLVQHGAVTVMERPS
ncbi:DUF3341 domain-containing protein [Mangrovicella endophytica]|uniref:DUF3341 domain-containing protein n=1 Tax=Mangrovicella endophytica TaxID=2066697 RepID=UPI000C9EC3F6|nr:DUF3341 domain-containing protein [Mangrovicella endophytica]